MLSEPKLGQDGVLSPKGTLRLLVRVKFELSKADFGLRLGFLVRSLFLLQQEILVPLVLNVKLRALELLALGASALEVESRSKRGC